MKSRIALNGNENNWIIGIGEQAVFTLDHEPDWHALDNFIQAHQGRTIFTALSYELGKKCLAFSGTIDQQFDTLAYFWVPESLYRTAEHQLILTEGIESESNFALAQEAIYPKNRDIPTLVWKAQRTKESYINQVQTLQQEIQLGNCYELNYCQLFTAQNVELTSMSTVYHLLNDVTKAPFSLFWENDSWMMACASPERFLQKTGNRLISQPIKGTAKRGQTKAEDEIIKNNLYNNPKERIENVMIVDLVRNDLSRIATKGSVKVEELFGIYSFPTVHQMISTIACNLSPKTTFSEIIRATFPMGSMTGAPKLAAVELSDQTEEFRRGWYSGAVGYISPNGDFDLNVVIRSLVYERATRELTCSVGGAITIGANPEQEYIECQTKVGKILAIFGACPW